MQIQYHDAQLFAVALNRILPTTSWSQEQGAYVDKAGLFQWSVEFDKLTIKFDWL